jgi:hypothetical protein
MGFDFSSFFGGGIKEAVSGVGDAAIKIRTAITGIDPAKQAEVELALTQIDGQIKQYQSNVLIAEIQGNSWMQRNWRPLLMLVCIAIIGEQYLFVPLVKMFWTQVPILTLPSELWTLMEIGVGGYIAGRTIEKTINK